MSATREETYEKITKLREQIDEAASKGEDTSTFTEQLNVLTEQLQQQVEAESKKKVIKG
jgi:hypothetical protein